MNSEIRQESKVAVLAGFVTALIFAFDLALPLGVAGGVPYIAVVLLGIWLPRGRLVIVFGLLTSLLTVLGYFLSPKGGIEWVVLTNRGLALSLIWIAVILVMRHKRTELALRQSEKLRSIIADAAPSSMIIMRRSDGTILAANPAFAELVAAPIASVEGRRMAEFYWDPSESEAVSRVADDSDTPASFEFEMRKTDASKIVVENTMRALEFGGERVLFGNFVDITARNEQAEQLLQSNAQLNNSLETFRSAIESMAGAFALWDANDALVICNQQFKTFYPSIAHMLVPGLVYEKLVRASVGQGDVLDAVGREEEWIQQRLDLHRNPSKPAVYKLATGRWVQSSEQRTEEGGIIGVRTDITDLQLAQEELRASEANFRGSIESSLYGFAIHDDLRPLYVNDALVRMLKYDSRDEVLDLESMSRMWAPGERARMERLYQQRKSGEEVPLEYEVEGICKDGSAIWFRIAAQFITWEGERMVSVTLSDITAQKQAEEAQRKLSRAVEQSPVSVIITDINGAIEYANPKFTELSGYDLDELRHGNPRVLKSGNTPQEVYEDLWQTIIRGDTWSGELQNKAKGGNLFWEHATISGVTDENGRITNYIAVKEDITERKQAEETQRRLMATIDGVDELISIYDSDDRLVYANQALLDLDHQLIEALRPGATFEARMQLLLEKNRR